MITPPLAHVLRTQDLPDHRRQRPGARRRGGARQSVGLGTRMQDGGARHVLARAHAKASKHVGLEVTEMAKSAWVFVQSPRGRHQGDGRGRRRVQASAAASSIEAGISLLKRTFRLDRCNRSGVESFGAYVWGSVLSCNVLVVARHLLRCYVVGGSATSPGGPHSSVKAALCPLSANTRALCTHVVATSAPCGGIEPEVSQSLEETGVPGRELARLLAKSSRSSTRPSPRARSNRRRRKRLD